MRGSVVKRGSTYTIVYDIGRDAGGKRQQKWEGGFTARKAAEKALRERLSEIEGSFVLKRETAPVSSYLRFWLDDYENTNLALSTKLTYEMVINRNVNPYIGHIALCNLAPEDITCMYSALDARGLSGSSILQVHRILSSALGFAFRRRVIPMNVMQLINPPRKVKYTPVILDESQLVCLLELCENTELQLPVVLAAMCGMRRGGILALMWDDINLSSRVMKIQRNSKQHKGVKHLVPPKSQTSTRLIMLAPHVRDILSDKKDIQQKNSDSPFVVLCVNGSLKMHKKGGEIMYRSGVRDLPFQTGYC